MKLIRDDININFVGKMKAGLIVSGIVIAIGVVSFLSRGERNFGIDFTGGVLQQVKFTQSTSADQVRTTLKDNGLADVSLQEVHDGKQSIFILRSPIEEGHAVTQSLTSIHGEEQLDVMREEMVGPAVGKDLRRQGLLALLFSLVGILIYISFRFEFRYAVGAWLSWHP